MKTSTRLAALTLATPISLFAYHPLAAMASSTPTCDGHAVTMTVTSHSAHTVYGTGHRDVIRITAPGHVVKSASRCPDTVSNVTVLPSSYRGRHASTKLSYSA